VDHRALRAPLWILIGKQLGGFCRDYAAKSSQLFSGRRGGVR
jgi:hypothetical protein